MSAKISFVDNVSGRHGDVLRSSAIFYFVRSAELRTTISFLNYWPLKRNIRVSAVASLRRMDGTLVRRDRIQFDRGMVCNYVPATGDESFEGSVEIEIFSVENLVIPYAAIMAVYETSRGFSMVHSYGRTYSRHEVEEGRTIAAGSEGCWTLRDDAKHRSFAAFHNGGVATPEQQVSIEVINAQGEVRRGRLTLPALAPYATYKLYADSVFSDLAAFLGGQPGSASVVYRLGESFVRMLVGNEARDRSDLQVTHSNFDYRSQPTDFVPGAAKAYMVVPALAGGGKEVIVYPHSVSGRYRVSFADGRSQEFDSGTLCRLPVGAATETLTFERLDGELPSRLVTAIAWRGDESLLPNECSLGVLHHLQPRKRMWWGICGGDDRLSSSLVVHDLPEIYGGVAQDQKIIVSLYSAAHLEPLVATLTGTDLPALERGVPFEEIFSGYREFVGAQYAYYTLFHEYGGLTAYTSVRRDSGSVCLEHGF